MQKLAEIGHKQFIAMAKTSLALIITFSSSLPFCDYKNLSLSCAHLQVEAKPGGAVVAAGMFSGTSGKGGAKSRARLCWSD